MSAPRLLVVDGNVREIRERLIGALGYDSGQGYAQVLRRIEPAYCCRHTSVGWLVAGENHLSRRGVWPSRVIFVTDFNACLTHSGVGR